MSCSRALLPRARKGPVLCQAWINSGDFFPTTSTIHIVPSPIANRFHSLWSGNDCLEPCSIKNLKAIFRFRRKTNKQKDHKQNLLKADTWNCFMSMIFSYYSIYYYKPSVYTRATAEVQHKSKASPHSRL